MDALQLLIMCAGLVGQILIARKDRRGYLCWIVGNIALVWVYQDARQFGLIVLAIMNTAIQVHAFRHWRFGGVRQQSSRTDLRLSYPTPFRDKAIAEPEGRSKRRSNRY